LSPLAAEGQGGGGGNGGAPAVRASRVPSKLGLFQENNGGKYGDGQHQHQPLKIVALEPSREVQNQYDDCNSVKGVKHDVVLP